MTTTRSFVLSLLAVALLMAITFSDDAGAIPAFARKYQISCSTCHAPFPRLKPFGEEFAARGFRMEDATKEPSRATFDVGDPLLKLVRDVPLAVRMDAWASYEDDGESQADFEWPWSLKILSGGPITEQDLLLLLRHLRAGRVGQAGGHLLPVQRALRSAGRHGGRAVPALRFAVQARAAARAQRLHDLQDPRRRAADQPDLRPRHGNQLARPRRDRGRRADRQRQRHRAGGERRLRRQQLQEHGVAPVAAVRAGARRRLRLLGQGGDSRTGRRRRSPISVPTSPSSSPRNGS